MPPSSAGVSTLPPADQTPPVGSTKIECSDDVGGSVQPVVDAAERAAGRARVDHPALAARPVAERVGREDALDEPRARRRARRESPAWVRFISSSTPLPAPPTARQRSPVPWTVKRVLLACPSGRPRRAPVPLRCRRLPPAPTTHTSSPVPQTLKKPGSSPPRCAAGRAGASRSRTRRRGSARRSRRGRPRCPRRRSRRRDLPHTP